MCKCVKEEILLERVSSPGEKKVALKLHEVKAENYRRNEHPVRRKDLSQQKV